MTTVAWEMARGFLGVPVMVSSRHSKTFVVGGCPQKRPLTQMRKLKKESRGGRQKLEAGVGKWTLRVQVAGHKVDNRAVAVR